jgi:hypothetical protein
MSPSTPGAKIPCWRTCLKGAWLIQIGHNTVHSVNDANTAFQRLSTAGVCTVSLLFSHPEIQQDISHDGLPIVSSAPFHQQVHTTVADHLKRTPCYSDVIDGDVVNCTTRVMKLTRGKLLQQTDWPDWQESEYLQLDQYEAQGMFGTPTPPNKGDAIFHLVWTYTVKAVDGRKKACCICDGSSCSGKVMVLTETYANCIKQMSARLFYAIAAAENLLIFGADVSNAFAKAPAPKQPFYIQPDRAFH